MAFVSWRKTCVKECGKGAREREKNGRGVKKLKFGGPHLGVVAKEADGIV